MIRVFNLMVRSRRNKNRRKENEKQERKILYSEAINFLLEESLALRSTDPELSKEYFISAQKMGMRGRQHLPKPYRLYFCRYCKYPVQTSKMQVRLNNAKKQITYSCSNCGQKFRFGYSKGSKEG